MSDLLPTILHVDGRCTGLRARRADRFWARAVGLLSASRQAGQAALELRPCSAVHTWGMRRTIDVAFVAADGRVLATVARLGPWRFAWCRHAAAVWELPAGSCDAYGVAPGVCLRGARRAPGSGSEPLR